MARDRESELHFDHEQESHKELFAIVFIFFSVLSFFSAAFVSNMQEENWMLFLVDYNSAIINLNKAWIGGTFLVMCLLSAAVLWGMKFKWQDGYLFGRWVLLLLAGFLGIGLLNRVLSTKPADSPLKKLGNFAIDVILSCLIGLLWALSLIAKDGIPNSIILHKMASRLTKLRHFDFD